MFDISSAAVRGHELAEEIRAVSRRLVLKTHALSAPRDAERRAVTAVGAVAKRSESHRYERRSVRVRTVAPLDEVHAVRKVVLVDVTVQQSIRPTARVAHALLDPRFGLDPDGSHASDDNAAARSAR